MRQRVELRLYRERRGTRGEGRGEERGKDRRSRVWGDWEMEIGLGHRRNITNDILGKKIIDF